MSAGDGADSPVRCDGANGTAQAQDGAALPQVPRRPRRLYHTLRREGTAPLSLQLEASRQGSRPSPTNYLSWD